MRRRREAHLRVLAALQRAARHILDRGEAVAARRSGRRHARRALQPELARLERARCRQVLAHHQRLPLHDGRRQRPEAELDEHVLRALHQPVDVVERHTVERLRGQAQHVHGAERLLGVGRAGGERGAQQRRLASAARRRTEANGAAERCERGGAEERHRRERACARVEMHLCVRGRGTRRRRRLERKQRRAQSPSLELHAAHVPMT
mmetsp:Transcript_41652/g.102482  ORF Transcript_41652/g.102482 Transcript_41652/m.102482 type:complete len:207 (-) Transcript_41652:511-1131(-)